MAGSTFWTLGGSFVTVGGVLAFDDHCCCESDSNPPPPPIDPTPPPGVYYYPCFNLSGSWHISPNLVHYRIPALSVDGEARPAYDVGDSEEFSTAPTLQWRNAVYCYGDWKAFKETSGSIYIIGGGYYDVGAGVYLPGTEYTSGSGYIGDRYEPASYVRWISDVVQEGKQGDDDIVSYKYNEASVVKTDDGTFKLHIERLDRRGKARLKPASSAPCELLYAAGINAFGYFTAHWADDADDMPASGFGVSCGYLVALPGQRSDQYQGGCHTIPWQVQEIRDRITGISELGYKGAGTQFLVSPRFYYYVSFSSSLVSSNGARFNASMSTDAHASDQAAYRGLTHIRQAISVGGEACVRPVYFAWAERNPNCPQFIESKATSIYTGRGDSFKWPLPARGEDCAITKSGVVFTASEPGAPDGYFARGYELGMTTEQIQSAWQNSTTYRVLSGGGAGSTYTLYASEYTESRFLSEGMLGCMSGEGVSSEWLLGSTAGVPWNTIIRVERAEPRFYPEVYNQCRPTPFVPYVPQYDRTAEGSGWWDTLMQDKDSQYHQDLYPQTTPSKYKSEPCDDCFGDGAAAITKMAPVIWDANLAPPTFDTEEPWFGHKYGYKGVIVVAAAVDAASDGNGNYCADLAEFRDVTGCALAPGQIVIATKYRETRRTTYSGPGAQEYDDYSSSQTFEELRVGPNTVFSYTGKLKLSQRVEPYDRFLCITVPNNSRIEVDSANPSGPYTTTTTTEYEMIEPPKAYLVIRSKWDCVNLPGWAEGITIP